MPMTIREYLSARQTMMELDRFSRPPATKAFLHGAHAMNGEAEREKAEHKALTVRLISSLRDQTHSKAELDDCNKILAVLS